MAIWNIAAGLGISLGARLLGGLFGGGGTQTTSQINEQGFVNDFAQPTSQYGQHIPRTWGSVRVTGNLLWALLPPEERVDQWDTEQRNGNSRTITTNRQAYYYGRGVWLFARETPTSDIRRVWLNEKLVYSWGSIDPLVGPKYFTDPSLPLNSGSQISNGLEFDHYRGTDTGNFVADVPYGWRKRSVVDLQELYLGEFGNSYPSASAEIQRNDPYPLRDLIAELLDEAGYADTEYDVDDLIGISVRGFKTTSADSVESYLQQLQQTFFFEYFESQGKLKFIKMLRPGVTASIPLTEMAAHEAGAEMPDKIDVEIKAEYDLPSQVEVNFNSITDVFYERKTVQSPPIRDDYENILSVNVEVTLTDDEALAIANKLLAVAWAQRKTYRFFLQPKYSYLEPGDVVQLSLDWESVAVQIVRTDQGANGLIKIEARGYSASVLGGTPPGSTPNPGEPNPGDPGTVPVIVPTTVTLQELTGNGVAAFISAGAGWTGAQLSYSRDGGTTYLPFSSSRVLSTPDGSGGFLTSGYYGKLNITAADIGQSIYVKAVSNGQSIDDAVAASIVISGIGLPGQITGFSPTQGDEGTAIAIAGFGFATATSGAINGTALTSFTVVSDTEITAIVGTGTTTGKITIVTSAGTIESTTDFVMVTGAVEWGQITGEIRDQLDLQDRFNRIRRFTSITGNVTIPSVGNTVNVTLTDPDGFAPTVPVCLFRTDTVGSSSGYAQMLCIARTGNTLTLQRDETGLVTQTSFLAGDIIAPIIDREVNIYGGLSVITSSLNKSKNIESISAIKSLILSSEYFQFLTPTAASVIVRLPAVTGSDYKEGEIINAGNGTNALVVQESDGTAIITLSLANVIRSIYYYWDGSIWRIFERNVYG